jgi:hypothetical protein
MFSDKGRVTLERYKSLGFRQGLGQVGLLLPGSRR